MNDFPQPAPLPARAVSVWATGQQSLAAQFAAGPYVSGTARDEGVPPAVAAHAVTAYSRPGDTVLDPDCGAGTVLVEALRAGRHAIGITSRRSWWPVARANITAAKWSAAAVDGMVLDGPPGMAAARLAGQAGTIDLILTALRTHQGAAQRQGLNLAVCRSLLRPGGHVIVVARPQLTTDAAAVARSAGLVPTDRCVALSAKLRDDRLVAPVFCSQRRAAARHFHATGWLTVLPAHYDVLIFRAPQEPALVARFPAPTGPTGPTTAFVVRRGEDERAA